VVLTVVKNIYVILYFILLAILYLLEVITKQGFTGGITFLNIGE
jgi:hypothetical protein